jgi:hypothetical protein
MSREQITIPAPIAKPGQGVRVRNYRLSPPRDVSGKVMCATYSFGTSLTRGWHYEVWVETANRDGGYHLYVSDNAISSAPTPGETP